MARKEKVTAPEAVVVVAEVAEVAAEVVAANPFAALVAAPSAAPLVGVKAKAATVLAANPNGVNTVGAALATVAPSIAAKGVANPVYPVAVAGTSYTLGAKLQNGNMPAKGVHDVAVVQKLQSLPDHAASTMHAAGVPWHSVAAYLKRGWLVKA